MRRLGELGLERGHQRLMPGYSFRIGMQKRFAKIRFCRGLGRAIRQENLGAVEAVERRRAARAVGDMTRDASSFGKELLTSHEGIGASAGGAGEPRDRKSTRLNSSHQIISYAVFCLKKKKTTFISLCLSTSSLSNYR